VKGSRGTIAQMSRSPWEVTYRRYGRYALFAGEIASGGMATLHLGRRLGEAGFARTVAIKRLRSDVARDPKFAAMFIDEARIAARIQHPNVTATVDVFNEESDICLVLEYVHGDSLRALLRAETARHGRVQERIAASILFGALSGLHAAHEARSDLGEPLGIVHRDVSPQNILVGIDGIARVVDFGVAKAAGRLESTDAGQIKGKLAYMAPEQIRSPYEVDRRTDVFSAGIVLWEVLTGQRLFSAENAMEIVDNVTIRPIPSPREAAPWISPALEQVVCCALDRDPGARFQTAREFARAIEGAVDGALASAPSVGEWVETLAGPRLALLENYLRAIERALPSDDDRARASLPKRAEEDPSHEAAGASLARPMFSPADDVTTHDVGVPRRRADADNQPFLDQDTLIDPMTNRMDDEVAIHAAIAGSCAEQRPATLASPALLPRAGQGLAAGEGGFVREPDSEGTPTIMHAVGTSAAEHPPYGHAPFEMPTLKMALHASEPAVERASTPSGSLVAELYALHRRPGSLSALLGSILVAGFALWLTVRLFARPPAHVNDVGASAPSVMLSVPATSAVATAEAQPEAYAPSGEPLPPPASITASASAPRPPSASAPRLPSATSAPIKGRHGAVRVPRGPTR
jgi:eukaryotic-like serine/threonine-protein kinase